MFKNKRQGLFFALLITGLVSIAVYKIIALGNDFTYADHSLIEASSLQILFDNTLYQWSSNNLGYSIRYTLVSPLNMFVAILMNLNFELASTFLRIVLPLSFAFISIYYIAYKIIKKKSYPIPHILAGLLYIANPVVFGDFRSGQTLWIYVAIPWVYYFCYKIFFLKESRPVNIIFLALALFVCYGILPPILIPLGLVLPILAFSGLLLTIKRDKLHATYKPVLYGAAAITIFVLLSTPYLLVTSSGQDSFAQSSSVSDYINNYSTTTLLNTFRLAGNAGNGQQPLGYNEFNGVNIFGYLLIGAITLGFILLRKQKTNNAFAISLFITLLVVVGFVQLITTNLAFGTQIFESQWMAGAIRNPTKLFVVLLPIFTLLFAIAIVAIFNKLTIKKHKQYISLALFICVVGYGWPILTGSLGLFHDREDKINLFRKDDTVATIINNSSKYDGKSVLIPSDHQDEINFQNIDNPLNTLRVGGSLPKTTELVKEIISSYNTKDPYLIKYLQTTGVKNVYLKKIKEERLTLYKVFPNDLTYESAKKYFLSNGLKLENDNNLYSHFIVPKTQPIIYSPKKINNFEKNATIRNYGALLETNSATIEASRNDLKFYNSYSVENSANKLTIGTLTKAQLYDPNIVSIEYYYQIVANKKILRIELLDPVTNQRRLIVDKEIPNSSTLLALDNRYFSLTNVRQSASARAGDVTIRTGNTEYIEASYADLSFETSIPKVNDASISRKGLPEIKGEITGDATDGKRSLLLSSNNHIAYFSKNITLSDPNAQYRVSFDYKNQSGNAPSFNILENKRNLAPQIGVLDLTKTWKNYSTYINTESEGKTNVSINFYSDGGKNLFDNIRIEKINLNNKFLTSIDRYSPDYTFNTALDSTRRQETNINFITNGTFENQTLNLKAEDASVGQPGEAKVNAEISTDAHSGSQSLSLSSSNHTAYVAIPINNFDANRIYKLSFSHKHVKGDAPFFSVWQMGINKPALNGTLKKSGWTSKSFIFTPDQGATGLKLYFYSPSTGSITENLFDDIKLEVQPVISTYITQTKSALSNPTLSVTNYKRHNPTLVAVDVKRGDGLIVLNESYHKGWKAYAIPKHKELNIFEKLALSAPGYSLDDETHVVANGFANSWIIEDAKLPRSITNSEAGYVIILQYTPQKLFYIGLAISGTTLSLCIAYIVYSLKRHNKQQDIYSKKKRYYTRIK